MQTAAAARVTPELIVESAQLERLQPEWAQLWAQSPTVTPFQAPAWLIPWWKHIGRGELLTIALRAAAPDGLAGRLIGLLPLYVFPDESVALRRLFPIGIGTTDYLDPLLAREAEQTVAEQALLALDERRDRWDELDWPQLRENSPVLRARVPPRWQGDVCLAEACPVLGLPDGVKDLPQWLPGSILQKLRYYRRRADKAGKLEIIAANPHNLEELYEAFMSLHAARWQARGHGGVLVDPAVQGMHRNALPPLLDLDLLRMWALRLDGRVFAVYYGLVDPPHVEHRRAYYYLGGLDPQYASLSPGTLLVGHAIEHAISEGVRNFDFLRGREPYKYAWGAKDQWTHRRRLRHGQ